MASAELEVTEAELEAQRSTKAKSGFKGVTVTTSKKFQGRIFIKTGLPQLDLGTFDTAEDAARAVVAAKAKKLGTSQSASGLLVVRCAALLCPCSHANA